MHRKALIPTAFVVALLLICLERTATQTVSVARAGEEKARGCRQYLDERSPDGSSGQGKGSRHAYFDRLVGRPDCAAAYSLRSQAEIDRLDTVNKNSLKKRAIVYDPTQDAAKLTIHAPTSTDIKGKLLPLDISSGSMVLTWDFRFDEQFRWRQNGYMIRHKTWRLLPGPWLAIRTDYKHAARQGKFGELLFSMPAKRFLGPGTRRGAPGWFGEMLQPQRATFYFEPDTWVRVWIFVQGLDDDVCYFSAWAGDERRDPIQLYDRIALIPNRKANGFKHFQIEYDTSGDTAENPREMHSWNRNVVVLEGVPADAIGELLERPRP
jgi:hypothetical protein